MITPVQQLQEAFSRLVGKEGFKFRREERGDSGSTLIVPFDTIECDEDGNETNVDYLMIYNFDSEGKFRGIFIERGEFDEPDRLESQVPDDSLVADTMAWVFAEEGE